MKVRNRLILTMLGVGILPMLVTSALGFMKADRTMADLEEHFESSLRTQALEKLVALREVKRTQIASHFANKLIALDALARGQDVRELYTDLVTYHNATDVQPDGPYDVDTPEYGALWESSSHDLEPYRQQSGADDLLLVCAAHGHVMFGCSKSAEMGTNLGHGAFKDSGLAELWRSIRTKGESDLVDFTTYEPREGAPLAFLGTPVRDDQGKVIGMLAIEQSPEEINSLMLAEDGLGESGETYPRGHGRAPPLRPQARPGSALGRRCVPEPGRRAGDERRSHCGPRGPDRRRRDPTRRTQGVERVRAPGRIGNSLGGAGRG